MRSLGTMSLISFCIFNFEIPEYSFFFLISFSFLSHSFHFANSSLSLWSVSKKKPLCTIPNAHSKPDGSSDDSIPDESWITSIASLRSTDLLASGNTFL